MIFSLKHLFVFLGRAVKNNDAFKPCSDCHRSISDDGQNQPHSVSGKRSKSSHAGHDAEMFLRKFWISLFLTIPVVIYSELLLIFFRWQPPPFTGSAYLPFILGSIVFFYGGGVFLVGAWQELKARLPGMMTLIAVAVIAAYLYSLYATFIAVAEHTLFWEMTTLITIMLLGHYLEMRAVSGVQSSLKELAKLLPDTAEKIAADSSIQKVQLTDLQKGDLVFVRPGDRVPADGLIQEGRSVIDESMMTGESKPVAKKEGDEVIAGTLNGDGSLKIRITKIGEHTFLAGVSRLVAEAQASKSRLQILADRAAFYLTFIAILGGFLTFFVWLSIAKDFAFAVSRLVAVLVVACPHALGLAIPLISSISTTLAAKSGFLIKQRLALESARKIDIILFDKTGTLTKGKFGITRIITNKTAAQSGLTEQDILRLAASIDAHSEHFIAKAIVNEAKKQKIELTRVNGFQRIPGKGVSGEVEEKRILVGGEAILDEISNASAQLSSFKNTIEEFTRQGQTVIYVIANEKVLGIIALADIIREESRAAIDALKRMGLKTAMITGDSEAVARWVAQALKIDEYFAKVLPADKVAKVKILQQKGMKVAMVGDGINDAPALAQADLGIAIGAGANVAIESAGIILIKNDPRDIVKIIELSRLTYLKMIENLFWATGYNVIALPLAAGVLISAGILLQPAFAALLMSLSTIIVALNAMAFQKRAWRLGLGKK